MPKHLPDAQRIHRDGTSQAARLLSMLQPEYVSVDERSIEDLLAFTREYARELRYYDVEDREVGDWCAFLGPKLNLHEAAAFAEDPKRLEPKQASEFRRPHFVLFLTFLKLLRHAQEQLNTLTRRHLEFYYQQVLRMTKKRAVPDRVNVLLEPTADVDQALLPAGSLLSAGQDSADRDRLYATDRPIVVNHARIARLSSVYADKRITGIREAREAHEGPKREAVMRMFEIALGDPLPGDPLPEYGERGAIDYRLLTDLQELVDFTRTELSMELFELHTLMKLKLRRDQSDEEWNEINALLAKAAENRAAKNRLDANFQPTDPRAFDANCAAALGILDFKGITEVENIYDLYDQQWRDEVKAFIREQLYFDDVNDFVRMMQIKVQSDNEWKEINRILEQAGQRKRDDVAYRLAPDDPTRFPDNLRAALDPLDFSVLGVGNIDEYHAALRDVKAYFFTSAGNFSFIIAMAEKSDPGATEAEWSRVYAILADAHRGKIYAARRRRLKEICEAEPLRSRGFAAMIDFALGTDPRGATQSALKRFNEFITDEDYKTVEDACKSADGGTIDETSWTDVYRIVEIAQRIREGFVDPVASKEEWLNLYPAEDATAIGVTLGVDADQDHPRWKTFGQRRTAVTTDGPPSPVLGWAVSSPVLALSEGKRTVTLTLGFHADGFDVAKIDPFAPTEPASAKEDESPFFLEISTAGGWIEPDTAEVKRGDYGQLTGASTSGEEVPALQFTLTFGEDVDPIAPLEPEEAEIPARWPVLRLRLRQIWKDDSQMWQPDSGQFVTHYPPFRHLVLVGTHVRVAVSGLTALQLQNDETALDASKPFEPFGARPSVGSRFIAGHPEVVQKRLDTLKFNIEWMGVPKKLSDHYKNYIKLTNNSFTARVSIVDRRVELPLVVQARLFAGLKDATAPHRIAIDDVQRAIRQTRANYRYERAPESSTEGDVLAWNRYLRWELNAPDFQHQAYPAVTSRKSIEMATAIAAGTAKSAEAYQVNPPYTPKIKSLSVDYTSSVEITIEAYEQGSGVDEIYHLHPFGYSEIQPGPHGCPFLPHYDTEGELYIGIQGVRPPQNLAILFQMAEGSADPDLPHVPVLWSYLSGNRWINLTGEHTLLDTTRGLINSGIIEFDLSPAQPNATLPTDLFWIRATVARHANSVCDAVAIHTQAVRATLADNDNAPDHFSRPLPAGSVTGLVEPLPEIRAVRQPYTSYGGKAEEQDGVFYTRVSERLRHKQRALTIWDYEHLVLERFPQIHKAKCLPALQTGQAGDPGTVEIIVIPDIRNRLPFNPFEPKTPSNLIAEIQAYLADKIPATATLSVRNAHFVQVKIRVGIRFRPGYNEGFYKQRLNEELSRFLSPWAYDEGADIVIGSKIYANSVVNFIDRREYVDYVAEIKLFSSEDGQKFKLAPASGSQGYFVTTERPDGVLVAARRHEIDEISEVKYEEASFTGIDYMKVGLDFQMSGEGESLTGIGNMAVRRDFVVG